MIYHMTTSYSYNLQNNKLLKCNWSGKTRSPWSEGKTAQPRLSNFFRVVNDVCRIELLWHCVVGENTFMICQFWTFCADYLVHFLNCEQYTVESIVLHDNNFVADDTLEIPYGEHDFGCNPLFAMAHCCLYDLLRTLS